MPENSQKYLFSIFSNTDVNIWENNTNVRPYCLMGHKFCSLNPMYFTTYRKKNKRLKMSDRLKELRERSQKRKQLLAQAVNLIPNINTYDVLIIKKGNYKSCLSPLVKNLELLISLVNQ